MRRQKLTWEEAQADRRKRALNAARGPQGHVCNGTPCTAFPGCTKWTDGRMSGIPEQEELDV